MGLIRYGMSSADLAEKIKKLSIDFDPTDDYLQALQKAGAEDAVIQALRAARPQPLTRDQVGKLVAGTVPSERAATLVTERGVDFLADEQYIEMLRLAGANDMLISAVREANAAATAQLVVETSPNAEVYLDNEIQGRGRPRRTDAEGQAWRSRTESLAGRQEKLRAERHNLQRASDEDQGTARGCAGKHKTEGPRGRQRLPGRCEPGKHRCTWGTRAR